MWWLTPPRALCGHCLIPLTGRFRSAFRLSILLASISSFCRCKVQHSWLTLAGNLFQQQVCSWLGRRAEVAGSKSWLSMAVALRGEPVVLLSKLPGHGKCSGDYYRERCLSCLFLARSVYWLWEQTLGLPWISWLFAFQLLESITLHFGSKAILALYLVCVYMYACVCSSQVNLGAGEMSHWVMGPTARPDGLSAIPGTHMGEGETDISKLSLTSIYVPWHLRHLPLTGK